jgi:hypothetical protein
VQLVAPAAVTAAAGVTTLGARARRGVVAAALVLPLASVAVLAVASGPQRTRLVIHDDRLLANPAVAAWVDTHTSPDQQVYAFYASADLYLLSRRSTDYRYLWVADVQQVPGAVAELRAYLAGPHAPAVVVEYQSPASLDPSGQLAALLATRYTRAADIDGFPVLTRRGRPTPAER